MAPVATAGMDSSAFILPPFFEPAVSFLDARSCDSINMFMLILTGAFIWTSVKNSSCDASLTVQLFFIRLGHFSLCLFSVFLSFQIAVRRVLSYNVCPQVSPADGSIVNAGIVNSCNVEQIKGVTYTIKTFLGEPTWNEERFLEDTISSSVTSFACSDKQIKPLYDKSVRTSSKLLKFRKADAVMNKLENDGCELLHLDLDDNKISANIKHDYRMLGWLVFYFQFCIKDLLINSFYIGFQIIYGIKSSIVLSNGKILKGASFLRSQFSFGSGNSSIFKTSLDAASTNSGISYTSDSNDSSDDDDQVEVRCYDPDWNEYRKRLLHDENNELYQFVVYLAPGDYHRFHSPADLKIKFRRHFQGELLSVHPKIAKWIPELFSLNERAVYVGEWQYGFFSMVAVGATNVGSIKVHTDRELLTNTRRWKHGSRFEDKKLDVEWKKGEEVGEFRLGSTIVLLFEAPKDFHFDVKPDQRIRVGEPVTSFSTVNDNVS